MGQDVGMETGPPRLGPQACLALLESTTERFAAVVAGGDLERPVPTCPGWDLRELARHLGQTHQWATHAVVAGDPDAALTEPPKDRADLARWYARSAGDLLATLRGTEPEAPVWAFGPKPRTAGFWYRRQAHEAAIHLWDAAGSQGAPAPVDDVPALDAIDEVVTMFYPRQVRLGRTPGAATPVAFEAEGPGGPWRWVIAGPGTGPESAPDAPAVATLAGPAEALLLLLWGRIGPADPRVSLTGDAQAALAVLSSGLTP
jgi:uncharacterized protein (TIGR03083 family)